MQKKRLRSSALRIDNGMINFPSGPCGIVVCTALSTVIKPCIIENPTGKALALCKAIRLILCVIQFKNSRCKIAIKDTPALVVGNEYKVSEETKKGNMLLKNESSFVLLQPNPRNNEAGTLLFPKNIITIQFFYFFFLANSLFKAVSNRK